MVEFEEAEDIRPLFNKILEICVDDEPIGDFADKIKIFLLEIDQAQSK